MRVPQIFPNYVLKSPSLFSAHYDTRSIFIILNNYGFIEAIPRLLQKFSTTFIKCTCTYTVLKFSISFCDAITLITRQHTDSGELNFNKCQNESAIKMKNMKLAVALEELMETYTDARRNR